MGVLSNGCKLGVSSDLQSAVMCRQLNGSHHHHGSETEGDSDEAAVGSGVSSASSIDSEELFEDSSEVIEAVQVLLKGLGEDIYRAGLVKTPLRVARAFAFATKGYRQAAKDLVGEALFPEAGVEVGSGFAGGLGGMVVVRSIDQYSLCGSCLLPFKVCCHIAYISSGYQVVGLSKLARVTDMFARRLQNPQTLADQICQGLLDTIKPIGVAVALQSWHLPVPGGHHDVCSPVSVLQHPIVTYAGRGKFEDKNSGSWSYFLALLRLEGISIPDVDVVESVNLVKKGWCPCVKLDTDITEENHSTLRLLQSNGNSAYSNGTLKYRIDANGGSAYSSHLSCLLSSGPGDEFSRMVAAVELMMEMLMGDTLKEDLRQTAKHYTRWLLHFKREHQESNDSGSMNGRLKSMNGHSFVRVPLNGELTSSTVEGSYANCVLTQLDAPFCSICEHHLLPFFGKAHIGYLSSEIGSKGVDRNTVLEIVEVLGYKLQVQERLTREIAEALSHRFNLSSIIVVVEASHVCMVSRGVEKLGSSTATDAVLGQFATDYVAKAGFLELILQSRKGGISLVH